MSYNLKENFNPTGKDFFNIASGKLFIADPFTLNYSQQTIRRIKDIKFDKKPVVGLPYGLLYSKSFSDKEIRMIGERGLDFFLCASLGAHVSREGRELHLINISDMGYIMSPYLELTRGGQNYKTKFGSGWKDMEMAVYDNIMENAHLKTTLEDSLILIGDAKVYARDNVPTLDVMKGNFIFYFDSESKIVTFGNYYAHNESK